MIARIKFRNLMEVRNVLLISLTMFLIGFIAYSPISQKAYNNNAPSYELSFDSETVKMIAGQSVKVKVNIERNGFEEPITLKAEDLPDGFEVEFEENPVEEDSATAWIYSPANVLQCENPIVIDSYENPEPKAKLRLMVNCGVDWVEQFGSAGSDALHNDEDIGNAVTTDNDGNIYVVGQTFGTVDSNNPNQGNSDVWVAKYANDGTQEWIRQLGSEGEDFITEVVADDNGNIFVGGFTHGVIAPNGSNQDGRPDYWIAKYTDGNEDPEWIDQSDLPGQDGKFGMTIIPDNQGGARLATLINDRTGAAAYDYNSNGGGAFVGGGNIASVYRNSPRDVALSENGDLYVVGYSTQNGSKRGFIIKFDVSGGNQPVWEINDLAITGDRDATRVIVDSSGDIYVAGTDVIFGTDTNAWFGKFSGSNGSLLWASPSIKKVFSQQNKEDRINTLGINSDGDLVIAGSTRGVVGGRNGGGEDAWAARFSSNNGEMVWMNQYPVAGDDSFEAVAFDSNDGVIFAGRTINWKNNIGGTDALLMRFVDSPPSFIVPQITNAIQDPNYPGVLRIQGSGLLNVTEIRINGISTMFNQPPNADGKYVIAFIPASIPPGTATLSVTSNCRTITRQITLN